MDGAEQREPTADELLDYVISFTSQKTGETYTTSMRQLSTGDAEGCPVHLGEAARNAIDSGDTEFIKENHKSLQMFGAKIEPPARDVRQEQDAQKKTIFDRTTQVGRLGQRLLGKLQRPVNE